MLRLLVVSSCVFAAAGAVAEPVRVSSAALKEMLPGALLEFDTPLRTTIPVRFSKDGLVSGKAGVLASVLGAERDRGRWWVENDRLCVKWFRWFEAKRRCVDVRQDGDRLYWRGEDRDGTAVIIDELGPVELRSQGHMPAVRDALAVTGLRGAIIVVRRALVPALLAELEASDAIVVDVEDLGEHSVEAIVDALEA